ncbi:type II toxin-antitoxin system VapC family toxin [Candidatus Palauibacter sp.]|uniref:type II toxin-antitoxin system VapC family toxin n=1 Tax=Candidatus Palauibacter sp. TaxID=3101350 RepID=UPI003B51B6C8
MNLLLDTHVWLWSMLEPDRLSRRARRELTAPANTLTLSPVSVWEALVLADKERVVLHPDPWSWIRTALTVRPMNETPVTFEVAFGSRSIRLGHDDPADRFIAATAMVHDLTLVTADAALLECPDIKVMPGA